MKVTDSEASQIFHYMDNDHNGEVSYNEFCELCEERRRNIDPFQDQEALKSRNKLDQTMKRYKTL
jgi:Ca2+-binding EF-hand superfamily protein